MKNETIFDGITLVRDDLVVEAETHSFKKQSHWRRWTALAAAFALAIGLGAYGLTHLRMGRSAAPTSNASGSGAAGEDGGRITYMSYAGPVFPLTAEGDTDGVTVERRAEYAFSAASAYLSANVTDAYALSNGTDADKTLSLLYPVAMSFYDAAVELPAITVNGAEVSPTLYAGPYAAGFARTQGYDAPNFENPTSWEVYRILLESGEYRAAALAGYDDLEIPAVVYKCENYVVASTDAVNPTLAFQFHRNPEKTVVMSRGCNGGGQNIDTGDVLLEGSAERPMYIILLGEDIDSYTLQGYQNGGCNPGEELEISATVTRYETTLAEVLREFIAGHPGSFIDGGDPSGGLRGSVNPELLLGAMSELLEFFDSFFDAPLQGYDFRSLEEIWTLAFHAKRVFYLAFDVTIPAGGGAEVAASMYKPASYDYDMTGGSPRRGYDLTTRLDSPLEFTAQCASLTGAELPALSDNSFGFDPAGGVTEVELDLNREQYWMQLS